MKKISPTAFAVMVRRALEYMCLDQKAAGKSLHKQLEDLAKRKIIPDTLAEMSDSLRLLGNLGAHASNFKIGREDTAIIDDFFMALLEYVYIAPEKIKSFKEKIISRTKR